MTDIFELATELKQNRDNLKRVYGDRYTDAVARVKEQLAQTEKKYPTLGLSGLTLEWGKQLSAKGVSPSLLFAAFVELCEERSA